MEVLENWGVPSETIIDAPNAADRNLLADQLTRSDASERISRIRDKYAKNKNVAIFVGRLIPLKGVAHLLEAWKGLSEKVKQEWELLVVGNGPLESLVDAAKADSVTAAGYVDSNEIGFWYAAADLHVFPTCGDVWGLVVNEASACGTPTLCSIHAGCREDLIDEGGNGLSMDFTNATRRVSELEKALKRSDLEKMGRNARSAIATYTPENLATRLGEAVSIALRGKSDLPSVGEPIEA